MKKKNCAKSLYIYDRRMYIDRDLWNLYILRRSLRLFESSFSAYLTFTALSHLEILRPHVVADLRQAQDGHSLLPDGVWNRAIQWVETVSENHFRQDSQHESQGAGSRQTDRPHRVSADSAEGGVLLVWAWKVADEGAGSALCLGRGESTDRVITSSLKNWEIVKLKKTDFREQDEKVVEIEMERLVSFNNHPFKVILDNRMQELQDSIKKYGILNRQKNIA